MDKIFCVVDIELTEDKEIIQFSATKLDQEFKELESINYYIKPKKQVSSFVTELTGISNEMLSEKMYFEEVAYELYEFIKNDILVCHGLPSDYVILNGATATKLASPIKMVFRALAYVLMALFFARKFHKVAED